MSAKVGSKGRTVLENPLPSITFLIDPAALAGMSPSLFQTLRSAMQVAYFSRFGTDFRGSVHQIKELEVNVTFLEMIYFLNLVTRPKFDISAHSKSGRLISPSSAKKWLDVLAREHAVLERHLLPEEMLIITGGQSSDGENGPYRPVSPTYAPSAMDVAPTPRPPPSGGESIAGNSADSGVETNSTSIVKRRRLESDPAAQDSQPLNDSASTSKVEAGSTSFAAMLKKQEVKKSPSSALGKPMENLTLKDFTVSLPKHKLRRYQHGRANRANTVLGSNAYEVVRNFVNRGFDSRLRSSGAPDDVIVDYRKAFLSEGDDATNYLIEQLIPVFREIPIELLPAEANPPVGFGLVENLRQWRAIPTKLFTRRVDLYDTILKEQGEPTDWTSIV